MSVSTQIERLQADRNTIRNKLIELGLAESGANLTTLATVISEIVDQGAVQVEILEGTSYTIPAGYHNGSGTVKAMTDTTGEAEKYKVQTKTVTPTKSQQSVTPDTGYYALGAVTVGAIPPAYQDVTSVTAAAGEVLVGKVFVAKDGKVTTGTMADNGAVSQTLDGTTVSYTVPAGYHNGSGKVTITLEEKTIVPAKTEQTVTPATGKVLSKVTVAAITDNFADTTDATATAAQILSGQTAYTWETNTSGVKVGKKTTGTMPDNGAVEVSLTPSDNSYTIAKGYHNGEGEVSVTASSLTVTPTTDVQQHRNTGMYYSSVYVNPIPGNYITTSDATAQAGDILYGETAYVNGKKVTGTMPVDGSSGTITLSPGHTGETFAAGYHKYSKTVEINLEEKTATPAEEEQEITPSSGKVLSKVTVEAIPENYADTTDAKVGSDAIREGYSAYGYQTDESGNKYAKKFEGSMKDNGAVSGTISAANPSYKIPEGYHNGSGTVSAEFETKTVSPKNVMQTVTASEGKVLGSVAVGAIPSEYIITTSATAYAGHILSGYTAYARGSKITGNITNNGVKALTITGLNDDDISCSISGYYGSGSKVSLTSDIETALAAI